MRKSSPTISIIIFLLLMFNQCGQPTSITPREFPKTCAEVQLINRESSNLFIRFAISMDGSTTVLPRTISLYGETTTSIPITGDNFYHFAVYRASTMNEVDEIGRFVFKNSNIGLVDICSVELKRDGTFQNPGTLTLWGYVSNRMSVLHTSILSPIDWDLRNPKPDIDQLDYGDRLSVAFANDRFKHIYVYNTKEEGGKAVPDLTNEVVRLKIYNNNPQHFNFSTIRIVYPN